MKNNSNKIIRTLKYLSAWERPIIESLYGINGKSKLTKNQVKQMYNVSNEELTDLFDKVDGIIANELKEEVVYVKTIDKQTEELIDRMSETFFNMFPNVEPVIVESALKILPNEHKKIVKLYYGLDGVHCADYDEIAEMYNMTIDEVDEILVESIFDIKKFFYEKKDKTSENFKQYGASEHKKERKKLSRYDKLVIKYGKDRVEKLFSLLKPHEQMILKMYYKSGEKILIREIAEKLNCKSSTVGVISCNAMRKLTTWLENPNLINVEDESLKNENESKSLKKSIGEGRKK